MYEWNAGNENHIAEHGVQFWEAEEALEDRYQVRIPSHSGRIGIAGRTGDGRLLAVFFERQGNVVRVVTARGASATEERAYRRANR
jgi:uncharacterized DUF497 family protein